MSESTSHRRAKAKAVGASMRRIAAELPRWSGAAVEQALASLPVA
jgi:hypothetical protein